MATDNFNRADSGTLGANWTTVSGEVAIGVTSNAASNQDIFNPGGGYYSGATPSGADHYAQAKYIGASAQREASVRVRVQAGARTYYAGGYENNVLGSQAYRIWKVVAGSFTSLAVHGSQTPAANDVVRLEISGSNLTLKVGGSTLLTATDSSISATGNWGLGNYTANAGETIWEDFDAADLATPAATLSLPTPSGLVATAVRAILGATTNQTSGTLYAIVDQPGNITGATSLGFPSNLAAGSDVRLEWSGGNLLPRLTHTAIWKAKFVQQTGYYAVAWHTSNDGTWHASAYEFGTHPYPCDGGVDAAGKVTGPTSSSGTVHYYEIAGLGANDYIASPGPGTVTLTTKGVWVTQARTSEVVNVSGTDYVRHKFWPDVSVPGTFIQQDVLKTTYDSAAAAAVTPVFVIGASPWTASGGTNTECASCDLRHIRLYSAALSISDIASEAAASNNAGVTSAGIGSLWYSNLDPTATDVTDKSVGNHSPTWANANRPTTNATTISAAQVKAGQNIGSVAALVAGTAAVSTTTPSINVAGLAPNTTYGFAETQSNVNGDSNVVIGTFTTGSNPDARDFGQQRMRNRRRQGGLSWPTTTREWW